MVAPKNSKNEPDPIISYYFLTCMILTRYLFVDEAGTSEQEPVTVVVGIIATEPQIAAAKQLLNASLSLVPEKLQKDFIFHATEIWNSKRLRADWPTSTRFRYLKALLAIPRSVGMVVVFAIVRRGSFVPSWLSDPTGEHLAIARRIGSPRTPTAYRYFMAFSDCLAAADSYMRRKAAPGEKLCVIAENNREMKRSLGTTLDLLRMSDYLIRSQDQTLSLADKVLNRTPPPFLVTASRILGNVEFRSKEPESVLQLADGCAFGLRRYFSELKGGEDLLAAALGISLNLPDWLGPCSMAIFASSLGNIPSPIVRIPYIHVSPQ